MRFLSSSLLLLSVLLLAVTPAAAVGLPAGTQFSIVANASFLDSQDQVVNTIPASASMTVIRVAGVSVVRTGSAGPVTPGQDVYIPVTVTNLGNAPDVFTLFATSASHWPIDVVYDDNADGVHQEDEQWSISMAGPMIADGYTPCFVKVSVPQNAVASDTVTLTAVSNSDAAVSDGVEVTLDTAAPPSVAITTPTADPVYVAVASPIDLGGTASGGLQITSVTWATDRGANGTCTGTNAWSAEAIALESGSNVVTITAMDSASRTATAVLTVIYNDSTPPSVAVTSPVADSTYATNVSHIELAGTASDGVGIKTVSWANDRGGAGTCTGTTDWSTDSITLASGENVITVSASDVAGNTGTDTLTVTYTPDPAAPAVQITSPTSSATYTSTNPTVSIAGTASDAIGLQSVAWSSDRGGSGACTGTTSWTASGIDLSVGDNVITVTATNTSGLSSTDTIKVSYDGQQAPLVAFLTPTANATYSTSSTTLDISGTAAHDAGITGVTWSNLHVGSGSCTGTTAWAADAIPLKTGTNLITVTATSTLGKAGAATLTVTCTAPSVTITSPTTAATYATQMTYVNLSGNASGSVAAVNWSSNRGVSGTCSGKTSWTASGIPLEIGRNVITVTASDALGHGGYATLTITRAADTTDPVLLITSPANGCMRNCPWVSIAGTAADGVAVDHVSYANSTTGETGECYFSGANWYADGIALALGDNEIIATATDQNGNTSSDSITVTYVDFTPGSAWTGIAMVSLPIVPDDADPKLQADFLSNMWCCYVPSARKYATYPDQRVWLMPADQTPGRGFWASFGPDASLPYGTIPPQNQPATIHLDAGWNLIGTPFVSPVVWDTTRLLVKEPNKAAVRMCDAPTLTLGFAWGWQQDPIDPTTGDYYLVSDTSDTNTLQPWRGYWIRAFSACDLIVPPPQ